MAVATFYAAPVHSSFHSMCPDVVLATLTVPAISLRALFCLQPKDGTFHLHWELLWLHAVDSQLSNINTPSEINWGPYSVVIDEEILKVWEARWFDGEHCCLKARRFPFQIPPVAFLCGVCMFFPWLREFSVGSSLSSHVPKACLLRWLVMLKCPFRVGVSVQSCFLLLSLCSPVMDWQPVTRVHHQLPSKQAPARLQHWAG